MQADCFLQVLGGGGLIGLLPLLPIQCAKGETGLGKGDFGVQARRADPSFHITCLAHHSSVSKGGGLRSPPGVEPLGDEGENERPLVPWYQPSRREEGLGGSPKGPAGGTTPTRDQGFPQSAPQFSPLPPQGATFSEAPGQPGT